jgi:peptidyl-prolyl cis-trans isomerase A (cyclophilin A)
MKTFKLNVFCAAALLGLVAAGCSNEKSAPVAPASATATSAAPASASAAPAMAAPTGSFDDPSKLTAQAPETFKAQFDTTKGQFTIEVTRSLAPNGADRFYNLVRSGYFTDIAFFRVIPGFMCQFGIHGDPAVAAKWREANITDDAVKGSNTRGAITFATAGPNTRTTQLFINFGDNVNLDGQGFSPFGKVTEGMDVVDKINSEYGEGAPMGRGPDQGRVQGEGNAYLKKDFPNLDYIKSATVVSGDTAK